jgi:hypothetical protein
MAENMQRVPQQPGLKIPGIAYGYATLGVLAGGSMLSLYGIMLAFVTHTVPAEDTDRATGIVVSDAKAQRLKTAMVALLGAVGGLAVTGGVLAGCTVKGRTTRQTLFFALFAGIGALMLLSTALAYTQDERVKADSDKRTGVAVGMGLSAVTTVGCGAGLLAVLGAKQHSIGRGMSSMLEGGKHDWFVLLEAACAGVGGLSLLSLYGVLLTFVLRTVPADDTPAAAVSAGVRAVDDGSKGLKNTMVGLLSVMGVSIVVAGGAVAGKLRGPAGVVVALGLVTGIGALALVATTITYTQDPRLATHKSSKDATLVAVVVSALVMASVGLAALVYVKQNRAVLQGSLREIGKLFKQGQFAAAGKVAWRTDAVQQAALNQVQQKLKQHK